MLELVRSLPLALDGVDVTGRTLEGMAWSWDRLYDVSDDGGRSWYGEGFLRGAAANSLVANRNTFELRHEHDDVRVGLVSFSEAHDGLMFRAVIDHGPMGDRELHDVTSSKRRGVSVRYQPQRNMPRDGPPWWRSKVNLRELSLTARPQYEDAAVALVRSQQRHPSYQRPADIAQLLDWQPPAV